MNQLQQFGSAGGSCCTAFEKCGKHQVTSKFVRDVTHCFTRPVNREETQRLHTAVRRQLGSGLAATTASECPVPQPTCSTVRPLSAVTTPGDNTFVSSPVPHIPCSFQPHDTTEPFSAKHHHTQSVSDLNLSFQFCTGLAQQIIDKILPCSRECKFSQLLNKGAL